MEFVSKEGDILILENNQLYKVELCLTFENQNYLIIRKLEMNIRSIFDLDDSKVRVVQEVIRDNDDLSIELVTDEELLVKIKKHVNEKM